MSYVFRAIPSSLIYCFFLLMIVAPSAQSLGEEGLSSYALGAGDRVRIAVYGEEELTLETQLSDAGTISYPFLGEIRLLGLTVGELERTVSRGLADGYLINPRVSVTILEYRKFFINGEVRQPGGFPYQPGLTVFKAISLAQGFTERASKRNIYIISDDDTTRRPRKAQMDSLVRPGDVITVRQSFF